MNRCFTNLFLAKDIFGAFSHLFPSFLIKKKKNYRKNAQKGRKLFGINVGSDCIHATVTIIVDAYTMSGLLQLYAMVGNMSISML